MTVVATGGARLERGMADDEKPSNAELRRLVVVRDAADVTVFMVGPLDLASGRRLRNRVEDVLTTRPGSITIDASGLTFVDSSGLAARLSARHALLTEAGGRVSNRRPVARAATRRRDDWLQEAAVRGLTPSGRARRPNGQISLDVSSPDGSGQGFASHPMVVVVVCGGIVVVVVDGVVDVVVLEGAADSTVVGGNCLRSVRVTPAS
jgi:anti-anti-sigma regulatory factor